MNSPDRRPVFPSSWALKNLEGKIKKHQGVLSYRGRPNDIRPVDVSLVVEGSGMVGLKDSADNKEWAGIFNHVMRMTGFSVYIATELVRKGIKINRELLINGGLNSHTQRRAWDEANWYPGVNPQRIDPQVITNEHMGVIYLRGKGVSKEVVSLVEALDRTSESDVRNTWEYRIAAYADHRTSQKIESLKKRMGDFFLSGYARGCSDEEKLQIRSMLEQMIDETKKSVRFRFPNHGNHLSFNNIDQQSINVWKQALRQKFPGLLETNRGISLESFLGLVMEDAETEVLLEQLGLSPESWTEESVPMSRWERYIRRLYINDAEKDIFAWIKRIKEPNQWRTIDRNLSHPIWKTFPRESWWGETVVTLYRRRKGRSYRSKRGKPSGIERAIKFFQFLEEIRNNDTIEKS